MVESSKAEARSNIAKKRKKKTNTLPKGLGTWLKKESSSCESGGDTDILDESENETGKSGEKKKNLQQGKDVKAPIW